ncbi:pyrin [Molossus molossus]|uniref:Pyrin n=1 Tax=Molossus molossus TaxID=27622 RepID=A0A7J8J054_MOLMO|nr:pyrin [Molossus molossus]KAF6490204.1 MEFV innate immuity regulator, pyrin [Molossus molossus]
MAKTPSDHLLYSLEELVPYDFEKFKFKLQNTSLEKEHPRIPRGQLQTARPVKLATLLLSHYGEKYAMQLTLQILKAINQHLLAEELQRAIGPECPIQESGNECSAVSCSSGENKPKSLKIPDGLEGDRQQQSGDGAASQPEAGKGPQKKPQGKRRDQKGSEGLDVQAKPGPRGMTLSSRKSPLPRRLQGEKGAESSVRLRRNASSAGRLQGLSSGSCAGSPGRKECKISEAYVPSKKNRPKSLEFTISSGERTPPNSETLLPQEKMRSENLDSAATLSKVATLDVGATVAPEKGSRNPEHSVILDGGAFRNMLSKVLLAGEEKTWEHPESTAPLEKSGIEGPETPETLGEVVGGELSNPEVLPPSGRPQDEAVCPLCHAQEGDPVGGTCVHDSCSCSVASRDPKASGGCLPKCLRCQVSLSRKSSGSLEQREGLQMASLSPQALPQCKRHMKQVQLLFCEDHGEPICLICSLSQEHRGHQVRPIEEAALEYKKQIQKQLEHLKELKKSGEEQRSQGNKNTSNYLKQTEIQKQRVRYQLEQLCQFLEQQERLFVAWLEELGQTIGQVRETYDTQVSRDIALLNKLIEELEAKQCLPEWELMQDIGVTLHRARTVTVPEPWATPLEVKEKIHLLHQKSEFVEKSMKHFSETLRSEMETFNVPELIHAQAHAVNVTLDAETAHPNLIVSDDLKSARLGNKLNRMPDSPERFDSCLFTLGSPSFLSGHHYWEVEVGDKTGWVLGICKASTSRKGSLTLSPENGYWVVMMMKRNEYQASTFPPTRLRMREPPRRVGIFLDYKAGAISFYNVTAKSHIYTFTSFSFSGLLQPIFSPGTHDGGKNMDPLTICPVGDQGPH